MCRAHTGATRCTRCPRAQSIPTRSRSRKSNSKVGSPSRRCIASQNSRSDRGQSIARSSMCRMRSNSMPNASIRQTRQLAKPVSSPNDKDKLPGPPATTSCRAKPGWRPRSASSVGSAWLAINATPALASPSSASCRRAIKPHLKHRRDCHLHRDRCAGPLRGNCL